MNRICVYGRVKGLVGAGASLILVLLLSGCGTMATPVMQAITATPIITEEREIEPTATALPTDTPAPPTHTPLPPPTATPTLEPTATAEPTVPPRQSPIDRLVAVRDIENGKVLFETFQDAANYSCSNCHLVDSEKTNLGPGLLNIKDRALTRTDRQTAAEYIYESIVDTQAYTVEGFDPELMPRNWPEIYSDLEIFDIVAYLMTLEGESDIDDSDPAPEDSDQR